MSERKPQECFKPFFLKTLIRKCDILRRMTAWFRFSDVHLRGSHFVFLPYLTGVQTLLAERQTACFHEEKKNNLLFSARINVLIFLDMVWFGFLIFHPRCIWGHFQDACAILKCVLLSITSFAINWLEWGGTTNLIFSSPELF